MSSSTFRVHGELATALAAPASRRILLERSTSSDARVRETTAAIIQAVREKGDLALRELSARYDGIALDAIEVPRSELDRALSGITPELARALVRAARNITLVHQQSLPAAFEVETEPGVIVGRRPDPLERVGVYAPGGRAVYPSSVLMGALPARAAGVREVVLCSPPGPDGVPAQPVLAAAAIAKIDRVFAAGGAGAIAAMALGTETIPRVQKIVGPGNAYVAEAKLQLSGFAAFDSPAGPSELLVLAAEDANPDVIVRESLAQAEHDPLAVVVILCASRTLADQIGARLAERAPSQPRSDIIMAALRNQGALLWCDTVDEMLEFTSAFAPEHLFVAGGDPKSVFARVRNTGTVFLGESSSVAFGDYMTGANHVLPTGTLARSYSGLSALDFIRWTTYQQVSPEAAHALAGDVAVLASAEQLSAHAAAAGAWEVTG